MNDYKINKKFAEIEKIKKKSDFPDTKLEVMVVTKNRNIDEINNILQNDKIKIIGENRIEESEKKFPFLKKKVQKHFIGNIQSRKIKEIVKSFDYIQSVCKIKHLKKINEESKKQEKKINIFIQISLTNENQKQGIEENEIKDFLEYASNLKNIKILGFMTMAKQEDTKENIRKTFANLRKIKNKFLKNAILSMGMTNDYKIAIEEGSNLLRIGRLFFL